MIGEWVVECDVVWCCCVRALRGKNKSEFLTKLKGVVTTFCDMIRHECPEGELIAPKYVSGHQCMCVCLFVLACVIPFLSFLPQQAMGLQFFHSTFPDFLCVMSKKALRYNRLTLYMAINVTSVPAQWNLGILLVHHEREQTERL